ncbi:MAG: DUF1775 domain-containing protein [Acidimicrobiales bacterium]|nr:DUF1775 domain-containing protein [Acidimicrobiales bacterium]
MIRRDDEQATAGGMALGRATDGVASIGLVAVVLLTLALWSSPAMAHVSSDPAAASGTTDDAGITTVVLSFDHGCGESPTTGLRVQLPDGTTEVTTTDPDGWTSAVSDGVVTWTGGSVAPKDKGSFELRARLVGQAGEVVYLPTVQTCPDGEEAWIEIPVDGAEPEAPAPAVTLTRTVTPAGTEDGTASTTADGSATTAAPGSTRAPGTASTLLSTGVTTVGPAAGSSPGTTGLIIFIAVLVIIGGGAVVLYLRNRRPRRDGA